MKFYDNMTWCVFANLSCSLQDWNQLWGHPPVFSCYQGHSSTWSSGINRHQHQKVTQEQPPFKHAWKPTQKLSPCSACAAHTMDVLLYVPWEVVIKDMRYVVDIQPSRCQVCSNQDANSTWKTQSTPSKVTLTLQPMTVLVCKLWYCKSISKNSISSLRSVHILF